MATKLTNGLPSEDQEQSWLVAWFRKTHAPARIFAIPNGGHRSKTQGMLLKATGVSAGVPDLFIPEPRNGFHGLFIEMKVQDGGAVSKEQKDWLAHLQERGYRAEVCCGFEEAKSVIQMYMEEVQ